jgi:hypothetical protein
VLKYGDLVRKAEHSLKESTHICATVCAQGRPLEDCEMESVLAYYWILQLKVCDLNISDDEIKKLTSGSGNNSEKIELIQSEFLQKSPATFAEVPDSEIKGYARDTQYLERLFMSLAVNIATAQMGKAMLCLTTLI